MATKTVCDICGKDAHATRKIDVCVEHSVSGSTRLESKPRKKSTREFQLIKCAVCGKEVKEGAGFSAHMRRAHPDEVAAQKK